MILSVHFMHSKYANRIVAFTDQVSIKFTYMYILMAAQ